MVRRRNPWFALRSSSKCSLPRVHITHTPVQDGLHHVFFHHAHFQSERGSLHMVQLALSCWKHASAIWTPLLNSALLSALVLTRPPRFIFCISCLTCCFDDERCDQPERSNMCIINTNKIVEKHSSSGLYPLGVRETGSLVDVSKYRTPCSQTVRLYGLITSKPGRRYTCRW